MNQVELLLATGILIVLAFLYGYYFGYDRALNKINVALHKVKK